MDIKGRRARPQAVAREEARQAPEVDIEWPADGQASDPTPESPTVHSRVPTDWPLIYLATVASLTTLLAALSLDSLPPVLLALLLLMNLSIAALLLAPGTPAGRALRRAVRAIDAGEHPARVADRLRGVELRGKSRLCLGIGMRCLEESGRSRRLEVKLRQEAIRWILEAKDGLDEEVNA